MKKLVITLLFLGLCTPTVFAETSEGYSELKRSCSNDKSGIRFRGMTQEELNIQKIRLYLAGGVLGNLYSAEKRFTVGSLVLLETLPGFQLILDELNTPTSRVNAVFGDVIGTPINLIGIMATGTFQFFQEGKTKGLTQMWNEFTDEMYDVATNTKKALDKKEKEEMDKHFNNQMACIKLEEIKLDRLNTSSPAIAIVDHKVNLKELTLDSNIKTKGRTMSAINQ